MKALEADLREQCVQMRWWESWEDERTKERLHRTGWVTREINHINQSENCGPTDQCKNLKLKGSTQNFITK